MFSVLISSPTARISRRHNAAPSCRIFVVTLAKLACVGRAIGFGIFAILQTTWCQTSTPSEIERLKQEVAQLRAENQLLRQLIKQDAAAATRAQAAPAQSISAPTAPVAASVTPSSVGAANLSRQHATQTGERSLGYWITSSTGKRHNTRCRWYGHSRGRPGSANEGIPCLLCGG